MFILSWAMAGIVSAVIASLGGLNWGLGLMEWWTFGLVAVVGVLCLVIVSLQHPLGRLMIVGVIGAAVWFHGDHRGFARGDAAGYTRGDGDGYERADKRYRVIRAEEAARQLKAAQEAEARAKEQEQRHADDMAAKQKELDDLVAAAAADKDALKRALSPDSVDRLNKLRKRPKRTSAPSAHSAPKAGAAPVQADSSVPGAKAAPAGCWIASASGGLLGC